MIQEISYEQVLSSAQSLSSSSGNMNKILDDIKQKMQAINTEDTWKSKAAAEFTVKFNKLASKFHLFYDAIQNYSKFLIDTVETYQTADAAIASKVEELL